ncbi:hypothetical protein A9239_10120 [Methanosarcina sp. A14]|nr:hypothetical protein A9239_10120 [Methanosarcina sp. A14]
MKATPCSSSIYIIFKNVVGIETVWHDCSLIVMRLNNATAQMRYNEIFVALITGVTIIEDA